MRIPISKNGALNLRMEKETLNKCAEYMITKAVKKPRVNSNTVDRLSSSVEPRSSSLSMRASRRTLIWGEKEASKPYLYTNRNVRKLRGCGRKCRDMCALVTGRFRPVPLSPFATAKTGKHFFVSFQEEEEGMQMITENEMGKPWNHIFLDEKQKERSGTSADLECGNAP